LSPLIANFTVSPLAWPVPQTARLPQTVENACGVLVPQTAIVPHTAPVPHTAQFAFRNTEVPHTARLPHTVPVPHTANDGETVPVPQTANSALGWMNTWPLPALKLAVGDSATPENVSLSASAAGMLR